MISLPLLFVRPPPSAPILPTIGPTFHFCLHSVCWKLGHKASPRPPPLLLCLNTTHPCRLNTASKSTQEENHRSANVFVSFPGKATLLHAGLLWILSTVCTVRNFCLRQTAWGYGAAQRHSDKLWVLALWWRVRFFRWRWFVWDHCRLQSMIQTYFM